MDSDEAISFQFKLWNVIGLNPEKTSVRYRVFSTLIHFFTFTHTTACLMRLLLASEIREICFVSFHVILLALAMVKIVSIKLFHSQLKLMATNNWKIR